MLKAIDIMTKEVYSVHADMPLDQLARLFVEKGVNAFPVVDEQGRLEGIVTETDLVEQDVPLHIPTVISIFDWVLYLDREKDFKKQVQKISARTVGEICTRDVLSCTRDTTVAELARLMVEQGAHLVPVVEDEKVLGVVARLDVIRSMGQAK